MHWADVIAKEVAETCEHPLIATGISPTGIIHVGSLREAITGESIRSAVASKGKDVRLIYLIDSFDPLRKRYEFLPEEYEKYVGMPICMIPCPCGKHRNYAHHFIQPFLDAVDSLEVHCEIVWTHELYANGDFAKWIDLALTKRQEVIKILHEVTGKEEDPNYAPYNPLCPDCGRFCKPVFESYKFPNLGYECKCGSKGTIDIRKMEGKLTWRLEWPAKWMIFGTSAEPFGKDHAAAGGSYDSGKRLVSEIFGGKAPYPIPYEFVQLKSGGQIVQMHKSLGSAVTGLDAIGMTPPEVLNYLFLRTLPSRTIDYDYGMGLLDMTDEYDRMERAYFAKDYTEAEENNVSAYVIAQHNHVPEQLPMQISYRHLVNVVQMTKDFDGVLEVLGRTEDMSKMTPADMERLKVRVNCIKYWLDGFAPENVKFSIQESVPADIEITDAEKSYFKSLAAALKDCEWTADAINAAVTDAAKDSIGNKSAFKAMYRILIGKNMGPRLGPFLSSMDRQFVLGRLEQASQ